MHLRGSTCHIAYSVFSFHCATVGDFNLKPLDFFCEFDSLRVRQWFSLVINIPNIQDFAHEFYDWLCFVEGSCRYWNIMSYKDVGRSSIINDVFPYTFLLKITPMTTIFTKSRSQISYINYCIYFKATNHQYSTSFSTGLALLTGGNQTRLPCHHQEDGSTLQVMRKKICPLEYTSLMANVSLPHQELI